MNTIIFGQLSLKKSNVRKKPMWENWCSRWGFYIYLKKWKVHLQESDEQRKISKHLVEFSRSPKQFLDPRVDLLLPLRHPAWMLYAVPLWTMWFCVEGFLLLISSPFPSPSWVLLPDNWLLPPPSASATQPLQTHPLKSISLASESISFRYWECPQLDFQMALKSLLIIFSLMNQRPRLYL